MFNKIIITVPFNRFIIKTYEYGIYEWNQELLMHCWHYTNFSKNCPLGLNIKTRFVCLPKGTPICFIFILNSFNTESHRDMSRKWHCSSVADPWYFGVIQIRGSMPLTNGSWSGSCYFRQDGNKKLIFKKSFSAYYFLKVHYHHFSKIQSQKEVTKPVSRIRIHRIHMFLGLPDTDPLVRGMDPDTDPYIIMQK